MEAKTIPWSKVKHHWEIYLFVLPTLVLIGLFLYYPASQGIFRSFYRWNGSDIVEWVGFWNYTDLLSKSDFWISFKVAFLIGIWNIVKMIPALLVAVCIHRCRSEKMQFLYRTLFVVPMVIPGLVVVLIWRALFFEATTGYMNKFLIGTGLFNVLVWLDKALGWGGLFVEGQLPAWLGDPNLILPAAIIWGFPWVGSFAVLTYLAKLQSIDKQLYEAGEIDGTSWWSKFTKIEFPLITGSIYIMLVFTIIGTISDAGMVIALAGIEGGPGGKLTVPAVFMLRKAFVDQQMGYACAVGIVLTIIVLILQKVANVAMDWEAMKRWQKRALKVAIFAVGILIIYFSSVTVKDPGPGYSFQLGLKTFLGLGLVLAVLPYAALPSLRRPVSLDSDTAWSAELQKQRELAMWARYDSILHWFWRTGSSGMLRLAKHAFIWMVLGFAFLPLYLMGIVSLKNNKQFYENPTSLTRENVRWASLAVQTRLTGNSEKTAELAKMEKHRIYPGNWSFAWQWISPNVANSIFISVTGTVVTLICAIAAAYFFARLRMPLSTFFWNAILILMMMPMIANLVPLFILLRDINLLNTFSALILVGAAGGQMMAIFVLRNFVQDIPQSLFDAAEIDGANHFQQLRNVVLPLSGPILGTVGIMQFISLWNEFVLALIIMSDQARLPVTVQLLRMAGEYIKLWGPLMAGYAIASIPVVVLFVFSMRLFIRGMTEGAVKG